MILMPILLKHLLIVAHASSHVQRGISGASSFVGSSQRYCPLIPLRRRSMSERMGALGASTQNIYKGLANDRPPFDRTARWVLVVDDEPPIRKAVSEYLRSAGYAVTSAVDATLALSIIRSGRAEMLEESNSSDTPPDCIVSDVRMPGVDGLQFLAELRADVNIQSVPVVLLTAKGAAPDRIAGYRAGADAYLPKPFDPDELLSIVDGTIQRQAQIKGENVDLGDMRKDIADIKRIMSKGGPLGNMVVRTDVWLTPRERDVINLLGKGYSNREIASELGMSSPDSVSGYCKAMMKKASVSTRSELLRWALDTGNVQ